MRLVLLEEVNHPSVGFSPYYIIGVEVDSVQVGTLIYRIGTCEEHYFDGHIGYTIEKPYRGHHYSLQACQLLLQHVNHDVMITCETTNIASKKIIEKLGASYIETKLIPSHLKKYYARDEKEKRIYIIKKEK